MEELLKIEDLSKSFIIHNLGKHINAIQNVNICINGGEFVGIMGKSGSGKSTILKCIYRAYLPGTGNIWYRSKKFGLINLCEVSERQIIYLRKYEIGYVSQFLNVVPRTTAREIVEQAALEMGHTQEYASRHTEEILTRFEIGGELWDSYPNTFSGGEKLRLNIARAMVKHPRLLLLDEPTASLDNESKERVKDVIWQLKSEGTTMIGIFHDIDFLQGICDKKYNMKVGELV